jgi:non-heme chloroperoxidase
VRVTHGRSDTVVLPAMSEHIMRHCEAATVSWFEGVGHASFLEEPERFNRELALFVREAANKPAMN